MERALSEDDPKFASTLRGTRFARATRARIVLAAIVFAGGVALLLTGAITGGSHSSPTPGILIGVVGFVLMLASATIGLSAWKTRQAVAEGGQRPAPAEGDHPGLSLIQGGRKQRRPRAPRSGGSRGTFLQRLEQRWQRRRDQNGF
ncbi:DUF3040 domain-containing protein [Nocardioides mangrovicus]|uniref:DUF3040 domain-containing protein n=2 Tax=Nocardioides mangrovicus TaxID=2478913 RepID=A0A3L8P2M8_9ACTN|nr:DUF3040 domain-containing protein [Nocardioides mangrovicus]